MILNIKQAYDVCESIKNIDINIGIQYEKKLANKFIPKEEALKSSVQFKVGDWVFGERLGTIDYNDEKHPVEIIEIKGNLFIYSLWSNPTVKTTYKYNESCWYNIKTITRLATPEEISKAKGADFDIDKEFVLPEKWCILKNRVEIAEYFNKYNPGNKYSCNEDVHSYIHYPKLRGICIFSKPQKEYTEITFDQFKKYVLKEETVEKWSVGTYVVFCKKGDHNQPIGTIDEIIKNVEENHLTLNNYSAISNLSRESEGQIKWFSTLQEAETFAKTLVKTEEVPEYIEVTHESKNNTQHPLYKEVLKFGTAIGKILKVIKLDNSMGYGYESYICRDGYVIYTSGCKKTTKEAYDKQNNTLQQALDKCITLKEGVCTNPSTTRGYCNEKEGCKQHCDECSFYSLNQEEEEEQPNDLNVANLLIETVREQHKIVPTLVVDEPVISKNTEEVILLKQVNKVKPIKI